METIGREALATQSHFSWFATRCGLGLDLPLTYICDGCFFQFSGECGSIMFGALLHGGGHGHEAPKTAKPRNPKWGFPKTGEPDIVP